MRVEPLELPEVLRIQPKAHSDDRGSFFEAYHADRYAETGISEAFVQDNQSFSWQNVLRGLHAQLEKPQGKLVRAIQGEIFDVAVDIRPRSATFGRWVGTVLSAENRLQLWIPAGFAHGFCVLSDRADVLYKCTRLYDASDEIGIAWNDPDLGIDWPTRDPILSARDRALPLLSALRPRLEAVAARGRERT
jgi:dTDP-4-dehydrorhamnose 3,5-epimerase